MFDSSNFLFYYYYSKISSDWSKMPKISVIMPVYNTDEKYLREAIESILNQTFEDFEFIIFNDGSSNNAQDVILSYKDSRIIYVKNEQNLGLIKTLNKGLDLSNGEYIARMDSDDVSLSQRFEKQVEFLDKNTDIHVLGTWFKYLVNGRLIDSPIEDKAIKECMLVNSNCIGHPTVMLRKSMIQSFNTKYDENHPYVEDYALWLSLINKFIDKIKFANFPEVLLDYRIHKNSVCQANVIKQSLNFQEVMFIAQGQYFGIDNKEVLSLISKLKQGERISSKDLLDLYEFIEELKQKVKDFGFNCELSINKYFYKFALKKCKKDFGLLKLFLLKKIIKL